MTRNPGLTRCASSTWAKPFGPSTLSAQMVLPGNVQSLISAPFAATWQLLGHFQNHAGRTGMRDEATGSVVGAALRGGHATAAVDDAAFAAQRAGPGIHGADEV